ncbi:hypothetical protein K469DRAFT_283179 [Zopfia rhizophila CBS 207.26]|uniref:Uncharacterized protein n=1 Tax=Zopfia rhizophila CBS 207.26 TaxID=1314779 RepID=A0A6A6ELL8_9PEZI|nr:hypothetical protein K469DRAFT_283179 [Zopfia rhizophila CBS 207.26]
MDDTAFIRFAIDQLTRDEEIQGSRMYPCLASTGGDYSMDRIELDELDDCPVDQVLSNDGLGDCAVDRIVSDHRIDDYPVNRTVSDGELVRVEQQRQPLRVMSAPQRKKRLVVCYEKLLKLVKVFRLTRNGFGARRLFIKNDIQVSYQI